MEVELFGKIHVLEFDRDDSIEHTSGEKKLRRMMRYELESGHSLKGHALELDESDALNVELHSLFR